MAKTSRKTKLPLSILVIAGLLLVVTAVLIFNQQASPSLPETSSGDIPYPEVSRISVDDSKAAYDQGSAVFLDVRSADSYAANHIPGAVSIPLNELPARVGELDPEKLIITYCT
jgi:3-mercaptopyruvate sulfurtransferase SseA